MRDPIEIKIPKSTKNVNKDEFYQYSIKPQHVAHLTFGAFNPIRVIYKLCYTVQCLK